MNPIPCFRGSTHLSRLGGDIQKVGTNLAPYRIRCRKINTDSPFLLELLRGEKKIERKVRSKNPLDGFFELVPLAPWRQTTALHATCLGDQEIIQLDFKNFYPSILCSTLFPCPAKLSYCQVKEVAEIRGSSGMLRVILRLKPNAPAWVEELHPFQIQSNKTSLPFKIERDNQWGRGIETFIQTNEIALWEELFELEPIEGIFSAEKMEHPLKNRCIKALTELETLRGEEGSNAQRIEQLKIQINAASSTPKIGTDRLKNSPFGVHCFPTQIISNGKALLLKTIGSCLQDDSNEILQVNTDGFLIKTQNRSKLEEILKKEGVLGNYPGQLRIKSSGKEALILGSNIWWLNNGERVIESCGFPKPSKKPVPLSYKYKYRGEVERVQVIHMADFKATLNFETLLRRRKTLPNEISPTTPWEITKEEKERSFKKTLHELRKYSKRFN